MKVDLDNELTYLDFDEKDFRYKNIQGLEKSIPLLKRPTFTYEKPGAFHGGTILVQVDGEQVDSIPYKNKDAKLIDNFAAAMGKAIFDTTNRGVNLSDPNGWVMSNAGIRLSNSFWGVGSYLPIAKNVMQEDDILCSVLKGAFKEYLVVTSNTLYIIKSGYLTGHLIGQGNFSMPLSAITNVSVDFHIMSGYFAVSAGGLQNVPLNYWSNDKSTDPAKLPNTISLNGAQKADFVKVANLINSQLIPAAKNTQTVQNIVQAAPVASIADELLKLKQLLDAGALTQEEFDSQKSKLLS